MKRFINKPKKAQSKFTKYAFKTDKMNAAGAYQRGGIRLS